MSTKRLRERAWAQGLILVAILCAVAVWVVWMKRGADRLYEKAAKREAAMERVQELEARNRTLRDEIRRLKEDPAYLELWIRKELDALRDGEVRIRFADPPSPNASREKR